MSRSSHLPLPLASLGLALLILSPVRADLCYLIVKGPEGNPIQGEVTLPGRQNSIAVLTFDHEVSTAPTVESFDVILAAQDPAQKIKQVAILRDAAQLGLKDATDLVQNPPRPVKQRIGRSEAEGLRRLLERAGGTVEIRPAQGGAGGKRTHGVFTLTKRVDRSSGRFNSALVVNDVFPDWELQCWRPGPQGAERLVFTIRLKNARVVSLRKASPNNTDPVLLRANEVETLGFTYESIEWQWLDGGITAADRVQ